MSIRSAVVPCIVIAAACGSAAAEDVHPNGDKFTGGTAPTTAVSGEVKVGGGQVSIGDMGAGTLRVGTADNRTNTSAQFKGSIAAWATAGTTQVDVVAADMNYYNNGTSPTWSGAHMRWNPSGMTGNFYNTNIPIAGSAQFIGQNASRVTLGTNGLAPIYFMSASGVLGAFEPTGSFGLGVAPVAGNGLLQLSAGLDKTKGIAFGGDLYLFRDSAGSLSLARGDSAPASILRFLDGSNQAYAQMFNGNMYIGTQSAGAVILRTGNTDQMKIDAIGNVGIGVSSVQAPLHIQRDQAAETCLFVNNANAGGYSAIRLGASDRAANGDALIYNSAVVGIRSPLTKPMVLETAGAERMRIDLAGNVGIGTAAPTNRLTLVAATAAYEKINSGGSSAQFGNGGLGPVICSSNIIQFFTGCGNDADGVAPSGAERMRILADGSVAINSSLSIVGKTTAANAADAKLHVKGKIAAQEVVVTLLNWADHVFAEGYRLPALSEVSAYITANNHLPGIPSESEVVRDGLGTGDMLAKHMAKIEELTLYAIKADQRADRAEAANAAMQVDLQRLRDEQASMRDELRRLAERIK